MYRCGRKKRRFRYRRFLMRPISLGLSPCNAPEILYSRSAILLPADLLAAAAVAVQDAERDRAQDGDDEGHQEKVDDHGELVLAIVPGEGERLVEARVVAGEHGALVAEDLDEGLAADAGRVAAALDVDEERGLLGRVLRLLGHDERGEVVRELQQRTRRVRVVHVAGKVLVVVLAHDLVELVAQLHRQRQVAKVNVGDVDVRTFVHVRGAALAAGAPGRGTRNDEANK